MNLKYRGPTHINGLTTGFLCFLFLACASATFAVSSSFTKLCALATFAVLSSFTKLCALATFAVSSSFTKLPALATFAVSSSFTVMCFSYL